MASTPLALSLRPWPDHDPKSEALPSLIPRITQQRGHLRHVTEAGLLAEIEAADAGQAGDTQASSTSNGTGTDGNDTVTDGPARDLVAAREEIIQQVGQAHEEAFRALDFVSLLLSKDTPRQAEISMSPYLKEHVPLGSLGADKTQAVPMSEGKTREDALVARGWKLQGLNAAADSLLRSANRLKSEVERETAYWRQVLAVKDGGWSICRSPREKHTLSVRYGFLEALGPFKDQGLATLRRGPTGDIELDQGMSSKVPQCLRVQIEALDSKPAVVSVSSLPSRDLKELSIEQRILQARNSIFDEELFYEMGREARMLANQGVRLIDSAIVVDLPGRRISLELVPVEEIDVALPTGPDQGLADGLVLTSRLLLSYAHRQNHRRRSQMPPPLTERARPIPPYLIIRPILTRLLHDSALRSLLSVLRPLTGHLRRAGLPATFVVESPSEPATTRPAGAGQTAMEQTMERVMERTETRIKLGLRAATEVSLRLRSQLQPPVFGREYLVSTDGRIGRVTVAKSMSFGVELELKRYLQHLASVAVIAEIAEIEDGSERESRWEHAAQVNELQKTFRKTGRSKRLAVRIVDDGLEMRWAWMAGKPGSADARYRWADGETAAQASLVEIARTAGASEP